MTTEADFESVRELRSTIEGLRAEVEQLQTDIGAINNDWHIETMRKLAAESSLTEARGLLVRWVDDVHPPKLRRDSESWLAANPESPNLCWKCGARKPTNFAREDGCSDCGASGTPDSPRADADKGPLTEDEARRYEIEDAERAVLEEMARIDEMVLQLTAENDDGNPWVMPALREIELRAVKRG